MASLFQSVTTRTAGGVKTTTVMILIFTVLCAAQPGNLIDCLYEMVSAIATIGLTRDFSVNLNTEGKMIIILAMYLGRIWCSCYGCG